MEKLKLLLGGSPCTHWSIAQTKTRETEPSGLGWELFLNYRIARDKYQPDYFLYENNKSMSPAIRAQITRELGVEPVLVNSALVSAQNRQRLYWVGRRNPDGTYSQVEVEQPKDRGILLRDILEGGVTWREKAYTLKANYSKASAVSALDGGHSPAPMAAEPVRIGTVPYDCPSLRVPEATKKGYVDIRPGDCVDLSMPHSKTRRGRSMRDKAISIAGRWTGPSTKSGTA